MLGLDGIGRHAPLASGINLVLIHEFRVMFFFFSFSSSLWGWEGGTRPFVSLGEAKVNLGNEERETEALNQV